MEETRLGEMEQRFADLIWDCAPVASGRLVQLCAEQFGWKKSTTYTMLKRLCDRGLFENRGGRVQVLLDRQAFGVRQGEQLLRQSFGGSLPVFLAAFTRHKRLTGAELQRLRQIIDSYAPQQGEEGPKTEGETQMQEAGGMRDVRQGV